MRKSVLACGCYGSQRVACRGLFGGVVRPVASGREGGSVPALRGLDKRRPRRGKKRLLHVHAQCEASGAGLASSISLFGGRPPSSWPKTWNSRRKSRPCKKTGVVVEACVTCAKNYGVVDALKKLDIDVKPMGQPLTERLKGPWKVLTF